jgi:hypothetical protein
MRQAAIVYLFLAGAFICGSPNTKAAEPVAPTEKEVTATLKAAHERPANNLNPAKSVEIKEMKISKESRVWSARGDVGGPGSTIWLVKINYLLRTHYNTRTVVYEHNFYYDMTKNSLDEWVIQTSSQAGSKSTAMKDEPASKPPAPEIKK